MIDYQLYDDFKDKLPPITFDKELSLPMHTEKPARFNERCARDGEVFIESLNIVGEFPDGEGLLQVSYADFSAFLDSVGIKRVDNGYFLAFEKRELSCFEAYKIKVGYDGVTVISGDTEGVRRALIYIEDEMKRRGGSLLPVGEISREPFIKNRISSASFSSAYLKVRSFITYHL